jgi:cyclopropane fatty-acyl-phospholipid synthase-like methyltransferase
MDKNHFEQKHMEKSWKIRKNSYQQFTIENSIKKFYTFLKSKSVKGKLLDIGCGSGKNTVYFSKKRFQSLGIDFIKEAIRISKKHAKDNSSTAKFMVKDIVTQTLNLNRFDVILDCGCLHHLRKQYWPKYKKNLLKVTKSGSYYYLHGFSVSSKKLGTCPQNRNWVIRKGHYTHFFSVEEVKKFLGTNFKILKMDEYKCLTGRFFVKVFYMQRK